MSSEKSMKPNSPACSVEVPLKAVVICDTSTGLAKARPPLMAWESEAVTRTAHPQPPSRFGSIDPAVGDLFGSEPAGCKNLVFLLGVVRGGEWVPWGLGGVPGGFPVLVEAVVVEVPFEFLLSRSKSSLGLQVWDGVEIRSVGGWRPCGPVVTYVLTFWGMLFMWFPIRFWPIPMDPLLPGVCPGPKPCPLCPYPGSWPWLNPWPWPYPYPCPCPCPYPWLCPWSCPILQAPSIPAYKSISSSQSIYRIRGLSEGVLSISFALASSGSPELWTLHSLGFTTGTLCFGMTVSLTASLILSWLLPGCSVSFEINGPLLTDSGISDSEVVGLRITSTFISGTVSLRVFWKSGSIWSDASEPSVWWFEVLACCVGLLRSSGTLLFSISSLFKSLLVLGLYPSSSFSSWCIKGSAPSSLKIKDEKGI